MHREDRERGHERARAQHRVAPQYAFVSPTFSVSIETTNRTRPMRDERRNFTPVRWDGQYFSGKYREFPPRTSKINCPLSAATRQISFLPNKWELISKLFYPGESIYGVFCFYFCVRKLEGRWLEGKISGILRGCVYSRKTGSLPAIPFICRVKTCAEYYIARARRFMYNYEFIYTTNTLVSKIFSLVSRFTPNALTSRARN